MNLSLSINRLPTPRAYNRPLEPKELLEAGILRDPTRPEQALRRAKVLVDHGRYREAREILLPHAQNKTNKLRTQIIELLATCAMHGAGGDWETLLEQVLRRYERAGDAIGVARAKRGLGEMLLDAGRFAEADALLAEAETILQNEQLLAQAAWVECLRARARLTAGHPVRALQRVCAAIGVLESQSAARLLAQAKLERARILAAMGDAESSAKDLMDAQRVLSRSGSTQLRIAARLVHAECLLLLGETKRAADGLKRLQIDVVALDDLCIRARVNTLLGEALANLDPTAARQALTRARHLSESLRLAHQVARCNILLAEVEHEMRLNATGRLNQIDTDALSGWGWLAAEYNMARAVVCLDRQPDRARRALLKVRSFASTNGNQALLQRVDGLLRTTGLVDPEELEPTAPEKPNMLSASPNAPEPYAAEDVYQAAKDSKEQIRVLDKLVASRSNPGLGVGLVVPNVAGVGRA